MTQASSTSLKNKCSLKEDVGNNSVPPYPRTASFHVEMSNTLITPHHQILLGGYER